MKPAPKPIDFEHYLKAFPEPIQLKLRRLQTTILKAAPKATSLMSYGMPAFKLNGPLVYFAAYKKHIGFYPGAAVVELFAEEIASYKWAKGSIQFPHERAIPLTLISKMTKFRVKQNAIKALSKMKTKKK